MLVSGGKVLAVDKVKTDENVFTGDGAFNPIGLKIEQPIDRPYGYNPALEKWVEAANAGEVGIDKVSHDKTLVGDGNANELGINLSGAVDPEKVYGFMQDGSMVEVATEGKKYEAGEYIDSESLDNGIISVTGVQEKGNYATIDYADKVSISARNIAINTASAYTNSQSYMYRSVSAGSIINSDSYALGSACVADGKCSVAEGFSTIAHGNYSHTEGYATRTISAETAPAIKNWREGFAAHAEGEDTRAYGNYSHTEGNGTITNNVCEHAEGRYNKSNFHSSAFGDEKNTLHSVGIGTNEYDHKNAFEIMQNGDTYLYGIGEYNGINASADDVQTLQDVINEKATTEYVDDKAEEASAAAVEDAASKYQEKGEYLSANALNDVSGTWNEVSSISGYGFSAWSAVSGGVISAVYTDDTLSGDGTESSALGVSTVITNKIGEAQGTANGAYALATSIGQQVAALGQAITIKGSINSKSDLPSTHNPGDAWIVSGGTEHPMYVWDSRSWIEFGTMPDLSIYAKKESLPDVKCNDGTVIVTTTVDEETNKTTYNLHANGGGGGGGGVTYSFSSEDTKRLDIGFRYDDITETTVVEMKPNSAYMPLCKAVTSVDDIEPIPGAFYFVYEE